MVKHFRTADFQSRVNDTESGKVKVGGLLRLHYCKNIFLKISQIISEQISGEIDVMCNKSMCNTVFFPRCYTGASNE